MGNSSERTRIVLIALGGNAILQPGQVGTFEEQLFNIDGAMGRIAALAAEGWRVVLTHGNGPQVGEAIIASLTEVAPAMAGRAGTHILPDEASSPVSKSLSPGR